VPSRHLPHFLLKSQPKPRFQQYARLFPKTREPAADNHTTPAIKAIIPPKVWSGGERFAEAEKAPATRAAYASDWRDFAAWCVLRGATALPAHQGIVAA
jgi:hypothetical protein